ncbi:MAG: ATP-binding cassette domain-containing protein, partial [Fusobacteriaceae bacterium]
MLEIKNLNKSYKDFKIENLNLEIAEGEILTILGESGSGKTTLLKIAGALDEDYTGEVLLNG